MSEPELLSPVVATYSPGDETASRGNGNAPLVLSDRSLSAKALVRADVDTDAASTLAVAYGTSRHDGGVLIAATRPDEWTLLGSVADVRAWLADLPMAGHAHAIDWTHGRAMFRLSGELAPRALEKVCGLDWSDAMTPDGAVVSGSVAKVTCDLIRDDVDGTRSYLVLCDRSFGQYLFDALVDACREFGVRVEA